MRIAIEGCTHGELDKIYSTIQELESSEGYKVDLLICCGDFQSTRNLSDLKCMACPDKYKDMCSFYKYYAGEAIAPILTIFIGGNHEASNFLQELAYGGWVAPNIYYMGYAGVIDINGVRIGGLSGIYKGFDYLQGHHEKPPYDDNTMRSCYHIRNVDAFRLKQMAGNPPDIMLSHDWPRSVTKHGNAEQLMRFKKHFRDEIEQDKLGSGPTKEILDVVKPAYWFAAHLHCKFAALVEHDNGSTTRFLALDKCLPGRRFLQVIDIGAPVKNEDIILKYDKHWLTVLKNTNHLLSVEKRTRYTPGPGCSERYDFTPTEVELAEVEALFNNDLEIPYNFEQSVLAYKPNGAKINMFKVSQPQATVNRQTTEFCARLGINDPMALLVGSCPGARRSMSLNNLTSYVNERETNLTLNSTLNITLNPDEISLQEEDDGVFDDEAEDVVVESGGPAPEETSARTPIRLPAPQLDSEDVDLISVLDSSTQNSSLNSSVDVLSSTALDESRESDPSSLFFIDKEGNSADEVPEPESLPHFTKPCTPADTPPVKKLKRRNAALYSTEED